MIKVKLSLLMFLEFLTLPVWFVPLLPYVQTLDGGGGWLFAFGLLMGIGTLASPVVCMLADRLFNAERVLAACNVACAVLLTAACFTSSPPVLFALTVLAILAYMPTWSVAAAIAMVHAPAKDFPKFRVFGSLGWVASAVFSIIGVKVLGIANFDMTRAIFAAGALSALLTAGLSLSLPATPPKARGQAASLSEAFGLKAFSLFADRRFAALFVLLLLAQIPFEWYMAYNSVYLAESGFRYLTLTQNAGQVAELAIMLAIPFVVRRFGYRFAFMTGLVMLVIRYASFLVSVRTGQPAFDIVGILMQGGIFGFVIVVSQMYVGEHAPANLINQGQGLVILLANGVGLFLSNLVFHRLLCASRLADGTHDWTVSFVVAGVLAAVLTVFACRFFPRR